MQVSCRAVGLLSAAAWVAALTSCASSGERDEVAADAITVVTASDVVDDAPSHSNGPWTWTGTVIQERDGVPRACFGEIQMSEPPSCPTGMPILDFDLSETPWAEHYEDSSVAPFASIVGHPTEHGFVLDGAISQASGPPDMLKCERIDTGAKSDSPMNPGPATARLQSRSARAAGVWVTSSVIRAPTVGAQDNEDKVRMDVRVLVFDDAVREWLEAQPQFDGFELTVCPQLEAM